MNNYYNKNKWCLISKKHLKNCNCDNLRSKEGFNKEHKHINNCNKCKDFKNE